jgi:hypothetical protein
MARDVIVLMRANPFRGPVEGMDTKNRDFLGPEMASSEASDISGTLQNSTVAA